MRTAPVALSFSFAQPGPLSFCSNNLALSHLNTQPGPFSFVHTPRPFLFRSHNLALSLLLKQRGPLFIPTTGPFPFGHALCHSVLTMVRYTSQLGAVRGPARALARAEQQNKPKCAARTQRVWVAHGPLLWVQSFVLPFRHQILYRHTHKHGRNGSWIRTRTKCSSNMCLQAARCFPLAIVLGGGRRRGCRLIANTLTRIDHHIMKGPLSGFSPASFAR